MAIVKGPFQITGSISGVSFYTRRGSDKVIMRSKGGISGDKIKRLPQYEGMRMQQKEWSGVTKFASALRYAFGGLQRLADYNITPVLNGLVNKIQKADIETEKGKRPVRFSRYRQALDGFNLNRNYPFNSVLRVSISYELLRKELKATVNIPRINTEIDIMNIQRLPYFRIIGALGTASDMVFDETLRDFVPIVDELHGASTFINSDWYISSSIVDEQVLTIQMTEQQILKLTEDVSVVLSIGIEFGTVGIMGQPVEVKYAGSAKVLKVN